MQMQKITTCLWFDGNGAEAAKLYVTLFRNSRIVSILCNGPDGPGPAGSALMLHIQLDGQELQLLNGGPQYRFTPAISLSVSCETQADVDRLWSGLLAGGGQEMACGWLTDRYGVSWQIVPTVLPRLLQDKDPAKAKRAMQAMMGMVKFDIAALQRAFDGI